MKKVISIMVLLSLVLGFNAYATEENVKPKCGEEGGVCENHYLVMLPKISPYNKYIAVSGNKVTVAWMTNYFMSGEIVVEGKNFSKVFSQAKAATTYHVVTAELPSGEYTIKTRSKHMFDYLYGNTYSVTIK